jgi:phage-related protein
VASQAEIDLVVDTSNTLSQLQRDLDRVTRIAQANTNPVTVQAVIDQRRSVAAMQRELDRVVAIAQRGADDIRIDVDINDDRIGRSLRRLMSSLGDVGRGASSAIPAVTRLGVAGLSLGAAVPAATALAGAVQNILPAAAVATQGMLAMQLVSGTLQVGMLGVKEAVETAFDPDATPEELAKSMASLAPAAKATVLQLRSMRGAFNDLKLDVQERLFTGFADSLEELSRSVLPDVGAAMGRTADVLNEMGRGAASAGVELSDRGILGNALKSTTKGLENLVDLPAQATIAFGQLASAAGPSFERITQAVANVADDISERLSAAFESGALENAIEDAIDSIRQLGDVAGNILGGIGNIFNGLSESGAGLFGTLQSLSQAFEDLTASSEFQNILNELSLTVAALVENVLPLLQEAFVQLAPVITELGPPLRDFINKIGPELIPVLEALGPVLLDIASIIRDQMPFAIGFLTAVLKVLIAIFNGLHFVLENIVGPALGFIATAVNKVATTLQALQVIGSRVTASVASQFESLKSRAVSAVASMAVGVVSQATGMAAGFVSRILGMASNTLSTIRQLPGQIRGALGNVGSLLFSAGADIINGLINGIRSKIGSLISAASDAASAVTGQIKGLLGIHSPSVVMTGIGDDTMQGFINGIEDALPTLKATVTGVAEVLPQTTSDINIDRFPKSFGGTSAPTVFVTIGNEAVDQFVTTRVEQANSRNMRIMSQGVRR